MLRSEEQDNGYFPYIDRRHVPIGLLETLQVAELVAPELQNVTDKREWSGAWWKRRLL